MPLLQFIELFEIKLSNGADGMPLAAQLFEQGGFEQVLVAVKAVLTLGLARSERAVTGFPNSQGRNRDFRKLADDANAVHKFLLNHRTWFE